MRKLHSGIPLILILTLVLANSLFGDDDERGDKRGRLKARLTGYQEVPQALSTTGSGSFAARLEDKNTLAYTLKFSKLEGTPTMTHIHLGQPWNAGGVMAFLCGGGGKPACEPDKDITGKIIASDIVGPAAQGIEASEFEEALAAIFSGATYVNVHSTKYPGGEIRGQIHARRHGLAILGAAGREKDDD